MTLTKTVFHPFCCCAKFFRIFEVQRWWKLFFHKVHTIWTVRIFFKEKEHKSAKAHFISGVPDRGTIMSGIQRQCPGKFILVVIGNARSRKHIFLICVLKSQYYRKRFKIFTKLHSLHIAISFFWHRFIVRSK